jgi:hypothetical protein
VTSAAEVPPLHLLLRWSADGRKNDVLLTETVTRHLEIAEEQGSVWWGKFHDGGTRPAMSDRRLEGFRAQIASGVETHVYLYRKGEVWRATILDLTDEASETDRDLLPGYYDAEDCHLFVRLTDFLPLTPEWPIDRLLLASDPIPGGMAGSLKGQQGVMTVLESDALLDDTSVAQTVAQPLGHLVERVPVEAQRTEEFEVTQLSGTKTARRTEQQLVLAYKKHLEAREHEVTRHRYRPAPDAPPLFCDLYDETVDVLIEAKGSATREAVRMAIGQLMDYRRFEKNQPALAVLLPARPSADLETLLVGENVTVIWRISKGEFGSTPAGGQQGG